MSAARTFVATAHVLFSLSFFVAASPAPQVVTTITVSAPAPTATAAGQCNTGPIQCCNQLQTANSTEGAGLLDSLGLVLSVSNVLLGSDCSPLSLIGNVGSTCSQSPVCCENSFQGGLINIGCIPIIL